MNKQLQKIKVSILFLLIFCSTLFIISPIGKSGPIDQVYECFPFIEIEYNESLLKEPIIPFDEPRIIPVKLKAKVVGQAADIVFDPKFARGLLLIVDLTIDDVPEGCHASITPPFVNLKILVVNEFIYANVTISITINQDLPVSAQKNVVVRISSRKLGSKVTLVRAENFTQDIPFIVGYHPKLSFNYIDGNVRNINPDETASFTFEIENWGNGVTDVISEIEDLPDGWSAEIAHVTTLGSEIVGGTSKKTISFKIKPPIDFGYHEDRAVIKVSVTPVNELNPEDEGEPHYLYFIIQSKGFSTPGFEVIILLFAIIFILYPAWRRKNRTNEKKRLGGRRKCQ